MGKNKIVTCGFIIKTERGILACHPTGKKGCGKACYDIPKGRMEEGETPFVTAIRELKEETGLDYFNDLNIRRLIAIRERPYNKDKNIQLYVLEVTNFPFGRQLSCNSMFINRDGKCVPEMDGYRFTWDIDIFYYALQTVFKEIDEKWGVFSKRKIISDKKTRGGKVRDEDDT